MTRKVKIAVAVAIARKVKKAAAKILLLAVPLAEMEASEGKSEVFKALILIEQNSFRTLFFITKFKVKF